MTKMTAEPAAPAGIEKLATGIPGLDQLLHGGIPKGRATLIAGKSGTCKSITAIQIATTLARAGHKALFLTVEESPDDVRTTGDQLGFDVTGLAREGRLRIVDLTAPMEGTVVVSGKYDVTGLVARLERLARDSGAQAVVLDSATALFNPKPEEGMLRSYFFQLVHLFRRLGLTAVVTAEAPHDYGPPLTTLGIEDFVCDLVLVLRHLVDNDRRRRSIEVHKYRRSGHYKGEYPYTITPRGLMAFPLDVREQRDAPDDVERFPSGLAGLDQLNLGGWLRDSIVLVRGPAGSGKTTLAGMYARTGALRGETVVYYGFEETRPILLRNFAAIGMPMEALVASGKLHISCRYPEATSPEDMLIDLRRSLDEQEPSLIVLDSISSVEHANSARGFRQFMIGLAALLREHRRSALLTQTITSTGREDIGAPYLSTIPDAILELDHYLEQNHLVRSMRIVKMRGSAHKSERHRLEILPGGLKVEPFPNTR